MVGYIGLRRVGTRGGGVAAPALPTISNLVAHWDFASADNLTLRADGELQYIEAAADLSGVGNTVSEAVAESQALWIPGAKNGRGVMRHNGAGNGLKRAAFVTDPLAQPILILSALKFPDNNRCFLTCNDASSNTRRFVMGNHSTAVRVAQVVGGTLDVPVIDEYAGSWVYRIDIINATTRKVIMPGGDATLTPTTGSMYGACVGPNGSNFAMNPSDADVGEIAIWKHSPSSDEITSLINYAKAKWAIS